MVRPPVNNLFPRSTSAGHRRPGPFFPPCPQSCLTTRVLFSNGEHPLATCWHSAFFTPGTPFMTASIIQRTASAYTYPLLIKNLFHAPVVDNPDQEIVYRDLLRYTYRDLRERVCRLAAALTALGVRPGDTVAVMDWDSHRYLECFFAVPMLGAVLHTINVRLSAEQVLYTIDHAEDDVPARQRRVPAGARADQGPHRHGQRVRPAHRPGRAAAERHPARRRIRGPAGRGRARVRVRRFRREHPGHDLLHHRHHRHAQGRVLQPPPAGAAHPGQPGRLWHAGHPGPLPPEDVYMPLTPMFHVHAWGMPYVATSMGVKQVYPGKLRARPPSSS